MMERLLGVTSLSADGSLDHFEWPEVNQELYTAYFERYVKHPGTPETAFWRVVAADIHAANQRLVREGKLNPTSGQRLMPHDYTSALGSVGDMNRFDLDTQASGDTHAE